MTVRARPARPDEANADGFVILPPASKVEPPPAQALRVRTHCWRGHPFDVANTVVTETGRRCRQCLIRTTLPPQAAFQETDA